MAIRGQGVAAFVLLALLCAASPAVAQLQPWVPERGHGSVYVAYEQQYVDSHTDYRGDRFFPAQIHHRAVALNLDYGLTDKLALNVNLPYRSNRHCGPDPHNAHVELDHDHGQNFIDDCRYHGSWGDWGVGLRYQWRTEPWVITPFVVAGYPATDYTTFSHAPAGAGIWSLTFGATVARRLAPPRHNAYVLASYGYSILEKVIDHRIGQSRFGLEAGYHFTPRFTARLWMAGQKIHRGYDDPPDLLDEDGHWRRDDFYFHHDVIMRNDYVTFGVGTAFALNDEYRLFTNLSRMAWSENSHDLDYAYTIGVGRRF